VSADPGGVRGADAPFTLEDWQIEDGPCRDGQLYCPDCITYDRCGCVKWEIVEHPGPAAG
jgi:hypothetical protein